MNKSFGKLIIVDDCGPVPELRRLLPEIAANEKFVNLVVNESNLGFVKSVNKAMKASRRDVVLLNADTEVHADWLDRLARQAHAGEKTATVTAFSNNATICTSPQSAAHLTSRSENRSRRSIARSPPPIADGKSRSRPGSAPACISPARRWTSSACSMKPLAAAMARKPNSARRRCISAGEICWPGMFSSSTTAASASAPPRRRNRCPPAPSCASVIRTTSPQWSGGSRKTPHCRCVSTQPPR